MLQSKDERIRELEHKLRSREDEIVQLKSQLDKFQSVFPFSIHATGKLGLNNNVGPRPRKQRAQGISAEPQSAASIQELSRQTFQTYDKNERLVNSYWFNFLLLIIQKCSANKSKHVLH